MLKTSEFISDDYSNPKECESHLAQLIPATSHTFSTVVLKLWASELQTLNYAEPNRGREGDQGGLVSFPNRN